MIHTFSLRLILIAVFALFLLTSCTGGVLTLSAGEVTGGVGAGLSQYQE